MNRARPLLLALLVALTACDRNPGTEPQPEPIASIEVRSPSADLTMTQTLQLEAVAKDARGRTLSGRTFTWTSSDTTVATVSETGLVRGVRGGEAAITASYDQVKGELGLLVRLPSPSTTEPTVHVNPDDAVFLTRPTENGEAVQYLGDRDAQGIPAKLRALRRGSPTDPRTGDVLTFNAEGLPAAASLRDGTMVAFSYGPDGQVILTLAVPGAEPIQQAFEWRPSAGTTPSMSRRSHSQMMLAAERSRSAVASAQQGTTEPVKVFFQANEPDGSAVTNATIFGWYGTKGGYGSFTAGSGGAPGLYVAAVPRRVVGFTEREIKGICQGLADIVATACALLSGGGTLDPYQQDAFSEAVKKVCEVVRQINPVVGTRCTGVVELIELLCKAHDTCEKVNQGIDWAIGFNETITVEATASAEGVSLPARGSFPPPYQNTFIRVDFPFLVHRIELLPSSVALSYGQTTSLAARVIGLSGAELGGRIVQWTSSDPTIAAVNGSTGLVTAQNKEGTATITATSGGKAATAKVTVRGDNMPPTLSITVSGRTCPEPPTGSTAFCQAMVTYRATDGESAIGLFVPGGSQSNTSFGMVARDCAPSDRTWSPDRRTVSQVCTIYWLRDGQSHWDDLVNTLRASDTRGNDAFLSQVFYSYR